MCVCVVRLQCPWHRRVRQTLYVATWMCYGRPRTENRQCAGIRVDKQRAWGSRTSSVCLVPTSDHRAAYHPKVAFAEPDTRTAAQLSRTSDPYAPILLCDTGRCHRYDYEFHQLVGWCACDVVVERCHGRQSRVNQYASGERYLVSECLTAAACFRVMMGPLKPPGYESSEDMRFYWCRIVLNVPSSGHHVVRTGRITKHTYH